MTVSLRLRLDGAVCDAVVTDDGTVTGSGAVRALAKSGADRDFLLTPTGPKVTVKAGDAASMVAWLCANAEVVSLDGGGPGLRGPFIIGGVS